jgi:drug/metabolite transporter (DMT)-like permease
MKPTTNKVMGPLEWLWLIILSVIWGGSFFFGKVALAELRPFTIVLGRVGIAAIALNLFVVMTGHRMPSSFKTWRLFLIMGALNNMIPFSLIFWGQTQIASGLASILNATTPLWTVLLANFLTQDERLTVNRLNGIVLGMIGVVIMIGPDALQGLGLNVIAQLAVLAATVSYASAGIFGKRFKDLPPHVTAAGQVTCSALMMIPATLIVDRPWLLPLPGAKTWGAVIGLALLCTAVAYVVYFRILATAGATNLLLVTFLIPISALILGMTILGERLDLRHFVGMGLIGSGLAAIDGRPVTWIRMRLFQRRGLLPRQHNIMPHQQMDDYHI